MFIANDSNYTFGAYVDLETVDITAPVYTKCFTDTEALKGYRFVHDPEETDPENCVCFSIYNETSSAALATPFGNYAIVSDLATVMFRLDAAIVEGVLRDVPYYHVIVPVQNIADDTIKYLVIVMTKEVELFPEDYPYYELVDTFAEAEPTSAEAPGGLTPTGTITITENDTYDVTNYASAEVNVSGGNSDYTTATLTIKATYETINSSIPDVTFTAPLAGIENNAIVSPLTKSVTFVAGSTETSEDFSVVLYKGAAVSSLMDFSIYKNGVVEPSGAPTTSGDIALDLANRTATISGDCTFIVPVTIGGVG